MGEWSYPFCGCLDDCCVCILAWLCPCYITGKIAEGVGESCCLHCIYSLLPYGINWYCLTKLREKYREQRGISGSFGEDCALTSWTLCALTQLYRETNDPQGKAMARE